MCLYFEENFHQRRSRKLLDQFVLSLMDGAAVEMLREVIDEAALANAKKPALYINKILVNLRDEKIRDLAAYRARSAKYRQKNSGNGRNRQYCYDSEEDSL